MRFVLVDRILSLEPGKRITATKRLSADEELFQDHFPGFPVVPGVLLTEMMAQAAGKCLDADGSHPGRAMLARIQAAEFRTWVRPDQEAVIVAEITQNRESYATAKCTVAVDGRKVSSSELFFAFAPFDLFDADSVDPVLEAYRTSVNARPE